MTTAGAAPARPPVVAAAQMHSHGGDVVAAVKEHVLLLESAAARGAELVVFPELSLIGYEPEFVDLHGIRVDPDHPALQPLADACRRLKVHALVGAPVSGVDESGKPLGMPQIGVLHIDGSGHVNHVYSKQHPTLSELGIFASGHRPGRLVVNGYRLALGVCADSGDPQHSAAAAAAGAQAYLVGALFVIGEEQRIIDRVARITGLGLWVVLAQYCGGTGGGPACGGSGIWGPDGVARDELADGPGVVVATLG